MMKYAWQPSQRVMSGRQCFYLSFIDKVKGWKIEIDQIPYQSSLSKITMIRTNPQKSPENAQKSIQSY